MFERSSSWTIGGAYSYISSRFMLEVPCCTEVVSDVKGSSHKKEEQGDRPYRKKLMGLRLLMKDENCRTTNQNMEEADPADTCTVCIDCVTE